MLASPRSGPDVMRRRTAAPFLRLLRRPRIAHAHTLLCNVELTAWSVRTGLAGAVL